MKASAVIKRPSEVNGVVSSPLSIRANVSRLGGASVTVDPDLDPTSTNPVENKAITEAIETINGNVSSLGNALDTLSGVVDGKYDASNPNGYISGISGNDVTTALGFTPYNATNPSGFVNATQAANAAPVQSVNSKTGAVVLDASDVGALPDSYDAPVSSVNSKTGAVTLSAADVGAIPDTTTFALGYDPDCSVGLAEVGDAVTDEPFYTPTGTVTAALNWEYKNNKLYIYGVNTTFTGNGVNFAVEQEN